jgi:uncharacterized membrane protein YhfC
MHNPAFEICGPSAVRPALKGDIMDTLFFSNNLVSALFMLLFTCIMLPVLYYIWTAYRRSINHWAILAGLAAFYVFGYMLSGIFLKAFAPEAVAEKAGLAAYALMRAFWIAAAEAGGLWITLLLLSRRFTTSGVPTGLSLGFQLFNLIYLGGINSFIRLGYAISVNKEGFETVLGAVEPQYASEFEAAMRSLAATEPYVFIMSAVDYAAMFALTAAATRIMWYSIYGGSKGVKASPPLLLAGFGLRLAAGIPLALYQAGAGSYKICAAVCYAITALAVAFAVWLSRAREDAELFRAERLKPRPGRKR